MYNNNKTSKFIVRYAVILMYNNNSSQIIYNEYIMIVFIRKK